MDVTDKLELELANFKETVQYFNPTSQDPYFWGHGSHGKYRFSPHKNG